MTLCDMMHSRLEEPCDGCEAPYGFRNHMKLTTDTAKFNVSPVPTVDVYVNLSATVEIIALLHTIPHRTAVNCVFSA